MPRLNSPWNLFALCFAVAVLSSLEPDPLWAAKEQTFVFRTLIDATPAGGEPDTPLTVTYTFDPDLRSQYDNFDPDRLSSGWYTPIHMMIQLGDESVKATQETAIAVFNNPNPPHNVEDSYGVRADNSPFYNGYGRNAVNGTLFGYEVLFIEFLIVDNDGTMFDNAQLPRSPEFAFEADYQQTQIELFDPVTGDIIFIRIQEFPNTPFEDRTPFSLQQVTKKSK
jgi:hypothetical protein